MLVTVFRDKYKIFLVVIAVCVTIAFVLSGGGLSRILMGGRPGEGDVAKVNGTAIGVREVLTRRGRMLGRLRTMMGDNFDPDMFRSVDFTQRALNELIASALLDQESKRLGIRATREAAEELLRSDPRFFGEDGKFNVDAYNEFVSDPSVQWNEVYESLERSIRVNTLLANVQNPVKVSESELRQEYRLKNEKVKVRYLALNPSQFEDEVDVTEEMINDYYMRNRQGYIEPEKIRIKYVVVPIAASDADRQAVLDRAGKVLARARAGEDLAELARRYSEAPGASEDAGEMEWVDERFLPEGVASAVSGLADGELSEVVETEQQEVGLYKCEGRRDENGKKEIKLRRIVFKLAAGIDTREKLASQIDELAKGALESKSLDVAAEQLGMEVKETDLFSRRDRFVQGIGIDSPDFVRTAFWLEEPDNKISDVVMTANAYYVLELDERKESGVRELAEVEAQVRNAVAGQEGLALAHKKAADLASRIDGLDDLKTVDEELASSVKESEPITRNGYVPGVPGDRQFYNVAFALDPGKLSEPILGKNGAYLLEVVEKVPFDEEKFEQEREQFREQLTDQKMRMLSEDWHGWLRARADVRLNEKLLAELSGS